jgi:DNA-binding MarR family transcriptional regulator
MAIPKQPRKARADAKPAGVNADDTPQQPTSTPPTLRTNAETYRVEEQIGFLLRCVHQRATEIFNSTMARHSVTPTQFSVLAKLSDLGSVSQNQLGRLTAMDPATTSGVVGRLITRGFVLQSPAPEDARLVLLSLTAAGKAAVAEMKVDAAEVSHRTLEPLSPDEAAALLAALSKIR